MLYVVCYDISNDRVRERAANTILDFGTRIQESVYECVLDEVWRRRLMSRLADLPLAGEDRVRVYRMCADCVKTIEIMGPGEVTRDPEYFMV